MPSAARKFECDVLVAGAGPAGIAAACAAAESGASTILADANPSPGGQIWRAGSGAHNASHSADRDPAAKWRARLQKSGAHIHSATEIVARPAPDSVIAESLDGPVSFRFKKLIIATGARERFLPFPGWTLPGVMGAGGLQALVKSGLSISGTRVVVAGTGPLLLAVAAHLQGHGAVVESISEQTPSKKITAFGRRLAAHPSKLWQAIKLRATLAGVPYRTGTWPVRAGGEVKLEWIEVTNGRDVRRIECDYLACGFDLVPNTELAQLFGCEFEAGFLKVNASMQTSVGNIFCAGEPVGIGGLDPALIEGQIAGYAASGNVKQAAALSQSREKARAFTPLLAHTFALRPELRQIADANTLVCRCEDVTHERLTKFGDWRAAKLQTRCGMGPCQGRVCGPAAEFLFGWKADSVRPPIFPARIDSLIGVSEYSETHLTV